MEWGIILIVFGLLAMGWGLYLKGVEAGRSEHLPPSDQ